MELKPCPFCGEKPKIGTTGTFYRVYCFSPSCYIRPNTRFEKNKEDAVEQWNRRRTD